MSFERGMNESPVLDFLKELEPLMTFISKLRKTIEELTNRLASYEGQNQID